MKINLKQITEIIKEEIKIGELEGTMSIAKFNSEDGEYTDLGIYKLVNQVFLLRNQIEKLRKSPVCSEEERRRSSETVEDIIKLIPSGEGDFDLEDLPEVP